MGKNTSDRQEFIIDNLKVELDVIEEAQIIQPLSYNKRETQVFIKSDHSLKTIMQQ